MWPFIKRELIPDEPTPELHIGLMVADAPAGSTQPVEARCVAEDVYEILYSPGMVVAREIPFA